MKDVEYVEQLLSKDFPSSKADETPYPNLDLLIEQIDFDYRIGTVIGEEPNGRRSRDGKPYLWFKHGDKRILTHRFIVAVTIGKWLPRELHVDHINNDPSDNRPENLRAVTPRDNAGNRRKVTLPELKDIRKIASDLEAAKSKRNVAHGKLTDEHNLVLSEPEWESATIRTISKLQSYHSLEHSRSLPPNHPVFTGETKPAIPSGVWHMTTMETWWWRKD